MHPKQVLYRGQRYVLAAKVDTSGETYRAVKQGLPKGWKITGTDQSTYGDVVYVQVPAQPGAKYDPKAKQISVWPSRYGQGYLEAIVPVNPKFHHRVGGPDFATIAKQILEYQRTGRVPMF